jgi:PAS domain S-box-containing protein
VLSLRTKILGIQALAITSTVVILGSLSYTLMSDALLEVQKHNLQHFATSSTQSIKHISADLQDQFSKILISRDLHRGSDLPIATYLSKHQSRFPELSVLNHEGREELRVIRERIVDPQELRDWSEKDLFKEALATPNTVITSQVTMNYELGGPTVNLAMALVQYFGDEFKGLLIGSVLLEEILTDPSPSAQFAEELLMVIDDQQQILYLSVKDKLDEPLSPAINVLEASLLSTIRATDSGFLEAQVFNQDAFVAYQTDPASKWTVLSVLSAKSFMAPLDRLRSMTIISCLFLLMGGMYIALRVTRHLTHDIDQLTKHAKKIAAGDLDSHVTTTSHDEIAELGTAFNDMASSLQRSYEARDRLDTILQSIMDPLLVTNSEGQIKSFNHAAKEMFQFEKDEILNTPVTHVLPKALYPGSKGLPAELVRESPLHNQETAVLTYKNEMIPVLLSCSYVQLPTKQDSGMVVVLKDISRRKKAEESLSLALAEAEASHAQVSAILRSVVDGLIVTDTSQRIILMNRATEKLFGVGSQRSFHKPIQALIANQLIQQYLVNQLECPVLDRTAEFEMNRAEDGDLRTIQVRSAQVYSKEGEVKGLITSLHDVTETRNVEKIKNEFISTAAHELNTPLASIMGFTELLVDSDTFGGFDEEQRREFLSEILEKTDVLARIVGDLLDLSRMETGHAMPLQQNMENLNETISKAVRLYQANRNEHKLEIKLEGSADTEIFIDQQRIIQVVENLISNAVKYSSPGSIITIATALNSHKALIKVQDQGVGMTDEQIARVFDKFYRADPSNHAINGLGMGMSIVQNIIHAHDGTINILSTPGEGTTVTVMLPIQAAKSES